MDEYLHKVLDFLAPSEEFVLDHEDVFDMLSVCEGTGVSPQAAADDVREYVLTKKALDSLVIE